MPDVSMPASEVLLGWLPHADGATLQPLGQGSGFSGAQLWKVEVAARPFVLRRVAADRLPAARLAAILRLQQHLAQRGVPAPVPVARPGGEQLISVAGAHWTLCEWLDGTADYWQDPRPEKLTAALATLALAHEAAAAYPAADLGQRPRVAPSPSLATRRERLAAIDAAALAHRAAAHGMIPQAHERALATEAAGLVALVAPQLCPVAERCAGTPLPLQWRLGDVWHDHVLFTGNRVTGLLDFGAAGIDSPAGDVARLLGSLAADDVDAWALGLAAYEAVRKLSPAEWQAAEAFDATGSTLAAWNWLRWLWPGRGDAPGPVMDRPAALERLQRLLPRLRRLAAGIAGARGGVDHGPGGGS